MSRSPFARGPFAVVLVSVLIAVGALVTGARAQSDVRSPLPGTLRRLAAIMHCRELLTLNVAPLLAVE